MEIKHLKGFPLVELVDCLVQSFAGYAVDMPSDLKYWARRYRGARVDRSLSFGAFTGRDLCGFIVHGIDQYRGTRTLFNTGTGVLPTYRGQGLVDRMYEACWQECPKQEVETCALEVLQDNDRAIRVYRRNGFEITRDLRCFTGKLDAPAIPLQISPLQELPPYAQDDWVSWDFTRTAMLIKAFDYRHFEVHDVHNDLLGSFTIDHDRTLLARIDLQAGRYEQMLAAVQKLYPEVRMVNVDAQNQELIDALSQSGLNNYLNQYEMQRTLTE